MAIKVQSIQEFSEIDVLLILIAAFVVVGAMCARQVNSSLAIMTADASIQKKHSRGKMMVTMVAVVTFLLRCVNT